jgi:hypothetical protein
MYDLINEALATIRHFRPLWAERYTLDSPWSEAQVTAFESLHRCRLPEEYRNFLLLCGVAGPGPDYGIFAPNQHFPGSGFDGCLGDDPDLGGSFPYTDAWNDLPEDETTLPEDYFSSRHCPGSFIISDRGCALWGRLIITGPSAGQIWHDDRADGWGLRPHIAADGTRYTFLRWYREWLDAELFRYGHAGNPK